MINKQDYIKKDMDNIIRVGLNVGVIKEGDYFVAYCPALNISSYGKNENEAKKRFEEEVKIFFDETSKRGTLEKLLLSLGWSLVQKPKPRYKPPKTKFDINKKKLETFTEEISIPI